MTADSIAKAAEEIVKIWIKNPDFEIKTPLRNERDDLKNILNDLTTQARSGIKGYFGADSTEYELAGGTRKSERKKAGPRKKTVATASAK